MKSMRIALLVAILAGLAMQSDGQITNGLTGHWALAAPDSATGLWLDDINGNNLAPTGTVADGTVPSGPCAWFDGLSSEYLSCPGTPSLYPVNGCFTVSAWVYVNGTQPIWLGGDQCIVSKGLATENEFELNITRDLAHVWFSVGPGRSIYSKQAPPVQQWFLITAWCNGTDSAGIQINLKKPQTAPTGIPLLTGTSADLRVGSWMWSDGPYQQLCGGVKGLRYWNRLLTQSERNSLFYMTP